MKAPFTLLDPRNGPDFDLPASVTARGSYVIASVPRSGSTLLARLLWETGLVGAPKEYLNPMQLRDWMVRTGRPRERWLYAGLRGPAVGAVVGRNWSAERLAQHIARVRTHRTSGGWFGLKIHHHHFQRYGGLGFIDQILPDARWIRISRGDRLGQAISWARALGSGQWAAWQPTGRAVQYGRHRIRQRLMAIERGESGWDSALHDRPVLHVSYESLVADPQHTIHEVLRWLDVVEEVDVASLPTRRQADAVTEAWRDRWAAGI